MARCWRGCDVRRNRNKRYCICSDCAVSSGAHTHTSDGPTNVHWMQKIWNCTNTKIKNTHKTARKLICNIFCQNTTLCRHRERCILWLSQRTEKMETKNKTRHMIHIRQWVIHQSWMSCQIEWNIYYSSPIFDCRDRRGQQQRIRCMDFLSLLCNDKLEMTKALNILTDDLMVFFFSHPSKQGCFHVPNSSFVLRPCISLSLTSRFLLRYGISSYSISAIDNWSFSIVLAKNKLDQISSWYIRSLARGRCSFHFGCVAIMRCSGHL